MGWADWMQVVPTTEEAFELERSVREVSNCDDEEALKLSLIHISEPTRPY